MVTTDPAVYDEIDAVLAPLKAAHPGISNGEVVEHLPQRLRGPFWERAVDRYLAAEVAKHEGGESE